MFKQFINKYTIVLLLINALTLGGFWLINRQDIQIGNVSYLTKSMTGSTSMALINANFADLNANKVKADDLAGGTGIDKTATGTFSFDCSDVEGDGINCSGENITLDATGDWTGTLDGIEGSAFALDTDLTSYVSYTYGSSTYATSTHTHGAYEPVFSYLSIAKGGTGTSTAPTTGKVLVGNASGGYDYVATSTFGGIGSMTYPGAGIALSDGSSWSASITNNSANWNTAYGWGDWGTQGFEKQSQASSSFATTSHSHSNFLYNTGTLTTSKVCQYNGAVIDCNLTGDGTGDCASGAVCFGDHTHSSYLVSGSIDTIAELNAILTGEDVASTTYQWITTGSNIYYSNNVGIGTTTPNNKLTVTGASTSYAQIIESNNNLTASSSNGLSLTNYTPATAGVPSQNSPVLNFHGNFWHDGTGSVVNDWNIYTSRYTTGGKSNLEFGNVSSEYGYSRVLTLNPDVSIFYKDVKFQGSIYDINGIDGNSGNVLKSTGTGVEWVATTTLGISAPPTPPGGADTQIQFNDGGSFGGDAGLVWDKTTDTMTLGAEDNDALILGVNAVSVNSSGSNFEMGGGNGNGGGGGGDTYMLGGDGGTSGVGGNATMASGDANLLGESGQGGGVYASGGTIADANLYGGNVILYSGVATSSDYYGYVSMVSHTNSEFAALFNTSLVSTVDRYFTFPDKDGTFAVIDTSNVLTVIKASTTQLSATGNIWANTFIGSLTGTASGNLTSGSIDTIAELNAILTGEDVASTSAAMTALSDATWTLHNSYPAACGANTWVTTIGDTNTCSAITYAGISAMTSANFAGLISDETGTAGVVVLSASPTLTGLTTMANASTTVLSVTTGYLGTLLGTIDVSGATSFSIPTAADPTVDAKGEIAIASSTVHFFDGSNEFALNPYWPILLTVASSTAKAYGINSASSSFPIGMGDPYATIWSEVTAKTSAGSASIKFCKSPACGGTCTEGWSLTTATTTDSSLTNGTWNAYAQAYLCAKWEDTTAKDIYITIKRYYTP